MKKILTILLLLFSAYFSVGQILQTGEINNAIKPTGIGSFTTPQNVNGGTSYSYNIPVQTGGLGEAYVRLFIENGEGTIISSGLETASFTVPTLPGTLYKVKDPSATNVVINVRWSTTEGVKYLVYRQEQYVLGTNTSLCSSDIYSMFYVNVIVKESPAGEIYHELAIPNSSPSIIGQRDDYQYSYSGYNSNEPIIANNIQGHQVMQGGISDYYTDIAISRNKNDIGDIIWKIFAENGSEITSQFDLTPNVESAGSGQTRHKLRINWRRDASITWKRGTATDGGSYQFANLNLKAYVKGEAPRIDSDPVTYSNIRLFRDSDNSDRKYKFFVKYDDPKICVSSGQTVAKLSNIKIFVFRGIPDMKFVFALGSSSWEFQLTNNSSISTGSETVGGVLYKYYKITSEIDIPIPANVSISGRGVITPSYLLLDRYQTVGQLDSSNSDESIVLSLEPNNLNVNYDITPSIIGDLAKVEYKFGSVHKITSITNNMTLNPRVKWYFPKNVLDNVSIYTDEACTNYLMLTSDSNGAWANLDTGESIWIKSDKGSDTEKTLENIISTAISQDGCEGKVKETQIKIRRNNLTVSVYNQTNSCSVDNSNDIQVFEFTLSMNDITFQNYSADGYCYVEFKYTDAKGLHTKANPNTILETGESNPSDEDGNDSFVIKIDGSTRNHVIQFKRKVSKANELLNNPYTIRLELVSVVDKYGLPTITSPFPVVTATRKRLPEDQIITHD